MMEEQNNFINQPEEELNIQEFLFKYLRYWYLFVFAVLTALIGAYIYNRYSQRVYQVNSKVLVQDSKKSPGGSEMLKELDIFKDGAIVENEIEIIHSRPVLAKALSNLNFDISYFLIGDLITSELYGQEIPFSIKPDSLTNDIYDIEFFLDFENNGEIKVHYKDTSSVAVYNQKVQTPFGSFNIVPNSVFDQSKFTANDYRDRNFIIVFRSRESMIEEFHKELKVATVNKLATVLELSLKTTVPEKGKDFLNEVVKVYIQNGIDQKNETASNTLQFIKDRLNYVSGDLTNIESEVEQYKKTNGIANISEEARFFLEGVKEYDQELAKLNMELLYIAEIRKGLNETEFKVPSFVGPVDQSMEKLTTELYKLQSLNIQYEKTLKSDNPLNAILKEQINAAKENIKKNVDGINESLTLRQGILQSKLSGYEKNIQRVPTIERDLLSIERQKLIKENLYLYLLQKQEESAIAQASTVSDNKIIEPAYYSLRPIKPVKSLSYLLAIAIGIVLPGLFLYLKDQLNNTVVSKVVIEKMTKTPVIGIVGQSRDLESNIAVHSKARSAISEELRSIRTNLQFMGIGVKEKTMLVTSSISGEGKTFISLNLALTFAISGKKTVVLEMDLRKPKLTKSIENSNPIGISNYLIGMATLDEIIAPSGINEHLSIISSGPIPPNPAELLMSVKLKELITSLEEKYDIIIIDTPPIGLVTDSLIITEHVDTCLYIIRQGKTPKPYLTTISELYNSKKMKNLSIVFNGIDRRLGNYGYGYDYGYGYGYYSEDNHQKRSKSK